MENGIMEKAARLDQSGFISSKPIKISGMLS